MAHRGQRPFSKQLRVKDLCDHHGGPAAAQVHACIHASGRCSSGWRAGDPALKVPAAQQSVHLRLCPQAEGRTAELVRPLGHDSDVPHCCAALSSHHAPGELRHGAKRLTRENSRLEGGRGSSPVVAAQRAGVQARNTKASAHRGLRSTALPAAALCTASGCLHRAAISASSPVPVPMSSTGPLPLLALMASSMASAYARLRVASCSMSKYREEERSSSATASSSALSARAWSVWKAALQA